MRKFNKPPILRVILIVWLVFTTLYFVYGEYNRLNVYVAQTSYTQGYQDSIMHLMTEASKCQPLPVTVGNQSIEVIALECLQPAEAEAVTSIEESTENPI